MLPFSTSMKALTEKTKAPNTPPMATVAARSFRYFPKSPATRNPVNGRSGMRMYLSIRTPVVRRLPLHQVELVDVYGPAVAGQQDDQCQGNGSLGCRHGDNEDDEDLPRQVLQVM